MYVEYMNNKSKKIIVLNNKIIYKYCIFLRLAQVRLFLIFEIFRFFLVFTSIAHRPLHASFSNSPSKWRLGHLVAVRGVASSPRHQFHSELLSMLHACQACPVRITLHHINIDFDASWGERKSGAWQDSMGIHLGLLAPQRVAAQRRERIKVSPFLSLLHCPSFSEALVVCDGGHARPVYSLYVAYDVHLVVT